MKTLEVKEFFQFEIIKTVLDSFDLTYKDGLHTLRVKSWLSYRFLKVGKLLSTFFQNGSISFLTEGRSCVSIVNKVWQNYIVLLASLTWVNVIPYFIYFAPALLKIGIFTNRSP